MEKSSVGDNIRRHRKAADLTQVELSKRAKISVNSLRRYEGGARVPRLDDLRNIATALSIPVADLIPPRVIEDANELTSVYNSNVTNADKMEGKDFFLQMSIEDDFFGIVFNAEDSIDQTTVKEIKDIPDSFFLNSIMESFRLLNRRGKFEAYRRMAELSEIDRFKDK